DAGALKDIDFSAFSAADFEPFIRRQPGAIYYLASALRGHGMNREADILLEKTFLFDADPWRMHAGRELAAGFSSARDEEAMSFARRYEELYPEDFRAELIMMKALFVSGEYKDLLARSQEFISRAPENLPLEATGEALLYRARAESRLSHPRFPGTLRRLFSSCPASTVHLEAWNSFFGANTSAAEKFFSQDEIEFFQAKLLRAEGAWTSVLKAYEKQSLRSANDPVFLREYAEVLQRAAGWRDGIKELERLVYKLTKDARLVCEEYLGKFYRLGGQYEKSAASFQNALRLLGGRVNIFPVEAGEETQKDRIIWYLLSSSLRISAKTMLEALPSYISLIDDREYFSDIFEVLASGFVRERDWERLASMYFLLKSQNYEKESGRYAFLLACAIRGKLYSPPTGVLPGTRELFEYAFAHAEPYYKILAGLVLKKDTPGNGENFFLPSPGSGLSAAALRGGNEDRYVRGFLDFGLNGQAVRAIKRAPYSLSPETILLVAESEAAQGRYIDTLRLLQRASRRPGVVPDRRMLEALYPQAYSKEMFQVIADTRLPPALFYGLVREESHFNAEIGSHAGAVGLAQLMPSTALEVAEKLKIHSPELTDPLTNLRLGSFYLAAQWKRFGDGLGALAAYNAGTNRMAGWREQLTGLPEVLFAEALSVSETREYIRKVLVAAVHYGYLYHHTTPRQTVREIFKDFS
ncbi:MAG: lytic transglycosylase domain-containing protein, partial [Spirochaetales bacterium]|nr:lytic transglycosylase domain-containing protein [Spirochaetales bacterium]